MKIIYDLGANNGDDLDYYLLKADKVVAIEANPALCDSIRRRYSAAVHSKKLVVDSCVITCGGEAPEVDFWIHNHDHVLSQNSRPATQVLANFRHCRLPARSIVDIVQQHGLPHYLKVDLEGYDAAVLKALFGAGIRPPYISAECHDLEVLTVLHAIGGYRAFKIVQGRSVHRIYRQSLIQPLHGGQPVLHNFPSHSAGPFGQDVRGSWRSAGSILRQIALTGPGWIDIHATSETSCLETNDCDRLDLARFACSRLINEGRRALSYAARWTVAKLKSLLGVWPSTK